MARNFISVGSRSTLLLVVVLAVLAYWRVTGSTFLSAAAQCGFAEGEHPLPSVVGGSEVEIWAPAPRRKCWLAFAPVQAAQFTTAYTINPKIRAFYNTPAQYFQHFQRAATAGQGPDITYGEGSQLRAWVDQNYLIPVDECRQRHPEYDQVATHIWEALRYRGQLWGIPIQVGMDLLYYNKTHLRALGWSERQIAALPEQIAQGEFTLEDLATLAQQAVDRGVVAPGFGYWPENGTWRTFLQTYAAYGGELYHPTRQKLMVNQQALAQTYSFLHRLMTTQVTHAEVADARDETWISGEMQSNAVVAGRVLFWSGNNTRWSEYIGDFADRQGGEDELFATIDVALFPSGQPYQAGNVLLFHFPFYAITAPSVSGRNQQAAACALLAQTLRPEINARNAISQSLLGVLHDQAHNPELLRDRFAAATLPMLAYAWQPPLAEPRYRELLDLLVARRAEVIHGALTPEDATTQVLQRIQAQLSDEVWVE